MSTIDLRGDLALIDGTYQVTGHEGSMYRLQNLATGEHTSEHLSSIFGRLTEVPEWAPTRHRALDELNKADRLEVQAWADHLTEMIDGTRPGHDTPRPDYDPALTTQNERVEAKGKELAVLGKPASRATLMRKKTLFLTGGAAALIDNRRDKQIGKFDRADSRVIDTIAAVMARRVNKSTITQSYLLELVEAELTKTYADARHDGDRPSMPSRASMYRYFRELDRDKHTAGPATTRRSKANTPTHRLQRTFRKLLPGQEVQIDSTPMDILVWVMLKGVRTAVRPTLTIMIDVATRSIIASTIRLVAAKGYDHALLLAQALTPFPDRPDNTMHRALVAASNPGIKLLSQAERLHLEGTRPFIFPRRITTDNGKDFLAPVFTSACRKFGIDIVQSAIHTPTDKAIVERTFQSINTLFTQRQPGYVGNHNVNRGYKVEDEELLELSALVELFDDWVANVWQNRKHSGLTDPFAPNVTYSPNQAYNAAAEYAGVIARPLSRKDFIDLLPIARRKITTTGVQLGNRQYDSADMNAYRSTSSKSPAHDNKWEVAFNPYDVMHVWVKGRDDRWIECEWRLADTVGEPHFGDISNATRDLVRNEVAKDHAAATGTPMPAGELVIHTSPVDAWTDDIIEEIVATFAHLEPFDADEDEEEEDKN